MNSHDILPAYRVMVGWGTSHYYPDRTHVVPRGDDLTLCGLPVHDHTVDRPDNRRVCPECSLLWIRILYPAAETPEHDTDRIPRPLGSRGRTAAADLPLPASRRR